MSINWENFARNVVCTNLSAQSILTELEICTNTTSTLETLALYQTLSKNGRLHWQRAITKFALYHSLSVTNEAFQKKANEAWNEFLILFSEQPE